MIVFLAACGALLVLLLVFLVRPGRIPARGDKGSEAVVAVYRRQLVELEADRRDGLVADDQYLIDRDDLEQRAITDLAAESSAKRKAAPVGQLGGLTYALVIAVPIVATLVYLAIGAPDAILSRP